MSKLEDSTKRRSNEVEEQSVTPRPPPKKRFLSRASSPDEDTEDNEDVSDTFQVFIAYFSCKTHLIYFWFLRNLWKHFVKMPFRDNGKII